MRPRLRLGADARPLNFTVRRSDYIVFIPDLTLCHYASGTFEADNWAVPLRAVGWLEHPEPYTTGTVPTELVARLSALLANRGFMYFGLFFCGLHSCSFCGESGAIWSQNLLIPGDAEVFVAPGGVVHYVESHLYLPPARFIDAVMKCPDPDSAAYLAAMLKSNAGLKPPLIDLRTRGRTAQPSLGADRETPAVVRRERGKPVCARVALDAPACGRSSSPF